MRCCVQNCFNDDSKKTNKSHGITFHKLPKHPDHSAAWLTAITRLGYRMNKCLVVCSEHFLPEDFDETRPNQRRIKSGAVPTIVTVCRVCLAVDVKMHNMKDLGLSEMFQDITGISAIDKKGSVLQRVCWECAARLAAAAAFREKALLSDALLKDQVHIKESDIALLKENYSSLKSSLSVKPAFTSYDIEWEHISENKEIAILRNDGTDIKDKKPEITIIEEEKEIEFEQFEAWIDVCVKAEVESDPIADTNMQDREMDTFSQQTHLNDSCMSPREVSQHGTTDTELQVNNNDKILKEGTQKKIPYINDAGNIVLVEKAKTFKADVKGNSVDETLSEEDIQTTAEKTSAIKCKQTMNTEVGVSNKRVRRMYTINDRIKEKIITLKNNGVSVPAIAKETGMSKASISCWWRRYRKNGNTYRRSITPRDQSGTTQNYCSDAVEPGKEMENCPTIVKQRLREAGLEHILMKKPERTATTGVKTSKRKALHDDLKQRIIALKQEGMSNTRIAYLLNTARNTVQKWWTSWCNEGHMQNHKQPGRKRKTTPEEDQQLIERVAQEQTVHTPSLAKEFGISSKCLTNRLKEAGFKNKTREAYVPLKAGRSQRADEEFKQQIIAMKLNGMSVTDIANQFRVPRTTIYQWWCKWQRWCKENNVKLTRDNNTSTAAEQDKSSAEHSNVETVVQLPSITSSQKSLWQKSPDV